MGAFLSQLVYKLPGDGTPSIDMEHGQVDHNANVCCGAMDVTEIEREGMQEEKDGVK